MLATLKELIAAADELDQGLRGAVVQKVYSPGANEVWMELRQPGRSTLVSVCARVGEERYGVADERPASPKVGSAFQGKLRKVLVGQKVEGIAIDGVRLSASTLRVDFAQHKIELQPLAGEHVHVHDHEHVHVSAAAPVENGFPLARALQARVATVAVDQEQVQRLTRIKKLRRTRDKVADEAARGPLAERMKLDGELLAQNLHSVPRGAKSVTLTEYSADGATPRDVQLDPKRSPKQQVDWLFHQYKRLTRGVTVARERLQKLDDEIAALEAGASPPTRSVAEKTPSKNPQAPSLPYREYVSSTGKRIWVGRGAAHNDTLTFRHARPHHLWLHARGVSGAHVLILLEKKESVDQQTLLDAAHLALHHSDLKGERTGEVSYTHVKYVRKSGGAPGAVTYTHDTTFWLRIEPARLERLTSS